MLLKLEAALRQESGPVLMELMRDLVFERPPKRDAAPIVEEAARMGLLQSHGGKIRLTDQGWRVGHALREYLLWEDRGRRMPRVDWSPALREESFRDRDVLEVGSGFGCNLLTLQPVARSIIGVEIDPLYGPIGLVLARIAGLPSPVVVVGQGEAIPRPDASTDVVLSFSSIQFMEIERALGEMYRVLRPKGHVVICTLTFAGFVRICMQRALREPRLKQILVSAATIVGTMPYRACGRLLLRAHAPVHLPFDTMRGRLTGAGFRFSDDESRIQGDEAVYVAYKA